MSSGLAPLAASRFWRRCGFERCARCGVRFHVEQRGGYWCPSCAAADVSAGRARYTPADAGDAPLTASADRVLALLQDLRSRGPATKAELSERLAWAEPLVVSALDQLQQAGEITCRIEDQPDVGLVHVWSADAC